MLSVIVPVYNSYPYLKKCLESICNQTYRDMEIICVDDGSDDGSGELLDFMKKKDERLQVLHQKNQGVSCARNVGLEAARGEIVTFVDSDDTIEKDMYLKMIHTMDQYNADIIHCGYKKIYHDGKIRKFLGTGKLLQQSKDEVIRCLITGQYFSGGVCNKIYKRKVIENIYFDQSLKINEDVLFNYEAFRKSELCVFWDEAFYEYYERQGSACFETKDLKKVQDCKKVAGFIWKSSKGEKYDAEAAYKYFVSVVNEYRTMLFCNCAKDVLLKNRIELEEIERELEKIPFKYKMSNWLLIKMPAVYKRLYWIYNHIRKQNWDIKE